MAVALQVIFGNLDKTSATAVVFSLSSANVTLTVPGATGSPFTLTMVAVGDDRGSNDANGETILGYTASQDVGGLPAYAEATWTATQGGSSASGKFHTSGTAIQDCAIAFSTCFVPRSSVPNSYSAFNFLQAYIEQSDLPLLSLIHIDDIYYADNRFNDITAGDNCTQGKTAETDSANSSSNYRPGYDYAASYFTWAGLLDGWDSGDGSAENNAALRFVQNNTCFMPQWGDHEFANNFAWENNTNLTTMPNPLNNAVKHDRLGPAGIVYTKLMLPLQGTEIRNEVGANDTNANHWFRDFCGIRTMVVDPISNANNLVTWLGANQIADILGYADCDQPFKIFALPQNGLGSPAKGGEKNENFVDADYKAMWVDDSSLSVMNNPKTNGVLGNSIAFKGDSHASFGVYWNSAANAILANTVAEDINQVGLSTMNGSSPGLVPRIDLATLETNYASGGGEVLGGRIDPDSDFDDKSGYPCYVVIVEFRAEGKNLPETTVKRYSVRTAPNGTDFSSTFIAPNFEDSITDNSGGVWSPDYTRKFVQYNKNKGFGVGEEVDYQLPTTAAVDSSDIT